MTAGKIVQDRVNNKSTGILETLTNNSISKQEKLDKASEAAHDMKSNAVEIKMTVAQYQEKMNQIKIDSEIQLKILKERVASGKVKDSQILKDIEELEKHNNKGSEILDKFKDSVDKSSDDILNRFNPSDFIVDLYNTFLDYLNSVKSEDLGFLFNSLIYVAILFIIYNITTLILSDKLISYFNLEKKYPKWAKLLQLRRKFFSAYMKIYIILATVIIILALFFNLYLLFT
jgi:hypothetical protein